MYEVVFETSVFYSVYVDAESQEEASDIAWEKHNIPDVALPKGFELDDDWFVSGVVQMRDVG